eukprot:s3238_g2.t1
MKKPAAIMKKPSAALKEAAVPNQGKAWLKINKTRAKKPERAYLCGTKKIGEKNRLIVEVSRSKSSNYNLIIDKIKAALEKDHLSKEEAKALKEELCSKYKSPLKKGSKEWRVKEQARQEWHDKSLQATPPIAEEPAEGAKDDAPLQKGAEENAPLEKGAKENAPAEKGAKENAHLEKGPEEAPVEKAAVENTTEKPPLGKGPEERKRGSIRIEMKKEEPGDAKK